MINMLTLIPHKRVTHTVDSARCECGVNAPCIGGEQTGTYVRGKFECPCGRTFELSYMPAELKDA